MVQRPQKRQYTNLSRSTRQVRPVLSTIFFLLAANLVAKGVASAYSPTIHNHDIQGSLYLQFGQNMQRTHQQITTYPYQSTNIILKPTKHDLLYSSTENPFQSINQQQIIHIHDYPYENAEISHQDITQNQSKKGNEHREIRTRESLNHISNKFSNIGRELSRFKRDKDNRKKVNGNKTKIMHNISQMNSTSEEPPIVSTEALDEMIYPTNVDIFAQNMSGRNEDEDFELVTIARQMQTTTVVSTVTPTQTTTTSTRATSTTTEPTTTVNAQGMNQTNTTGYNYTANGYGPYSGNENVSITTMPTTNVTTNTTTNVTTTTNPSYYYYPVENYGPSNGNENISITYGPPVGHRPFFSSPEDQFLNNQLYNNYGNDNSFNFFEHQNDYEYNKSPEISKYNDLVQQFYNMYNYHYPAFYNNNNNGK